MTARRGRARDPGAARRVDGRRVGARAPACTTTRGACEPGDLFVARRGAHARRRALRRATRSTRGAVAVLAGARHARPTARRSRSSTCDDVADGARVRGGRGLRASRVLRSRSSASPARTARRRRRTSSARRSTARSARRAAASSARSGIASASSHDRRGAHDARGRRARARSLAVMREARRDARRDGGLVDRARARARARGALPRRGVHEPHAGSPRLSRHDGGLRRRRRRSSSRRASPGARSSTSTMPSGAKLVGARRGAASVSRAARAARRRRRRRRARAARRRERGIDGASCATPGGDVSRSRSPLVGAHNVENLAGRARRRVRARPRRRPRARAGARDRDRRARAARALRRTGRRRRRCSSTTRTRPTRSRACSTAVRAVDDEGASVCVFGCGGDRDADEARARWARPSARAPTSSIVTSDNPRTEEPEAIAEPIEEASRVGLARIAAESPRARLRRRARPRARDRRSPIRGAAPGDVVLVAGKGHEDYQIVGTEKRPFDDRDEARARCARAARERRAALMATPIPTNRARVHRRARPPRRPAATIVRDAGRAARRDRRQRHAARSRPGDAFVALRGETHDGHAFLDGGASRGAARARRRARTRRASRTDVERRPRSTTRSSRWGDLARAHLDAWRAREPTAARRRDHRQRRARRRRRSSARRSSSAVAPSARHRRATSTTASAFPPSCFGARGARTASPSSRCGMSVPRRDRRARARSPSPTSPSSRTSGVAHAEGVGGTRDGVAREKGALFAALARERRRRRQRRRRARRARSPRTLARATSRFGRSEGADVSPRWAASRADRRLARRDRAPCDACASPRAREIIELELPLLGEAAAIDLARRARRGRGRARRARRRDAIDARARSASRTSPAARAHRSSSATVLVIDDTYNANPASMRAALATARRDRRPTRRRVAVLGEMRELGAVAERASTRRSATPSPTRASPSRSAAAASSTAPSMRAPRERGVDVVDGARRRGGRHAMRPSRVRAGDVVLVKGSRSVGAETRRRRARRSLARGRHVCDAGASQHDLRAPLPAAPLRAAGSAGSTSSATSRSASSRRRSRRCCISLRRSRRGSSASCRRSRSARSSASDGPETHNQEARHADDGRRAHPALACSCRRSSGATCATSSSGRRRRSPRATASSATSTTT